MHWCASQYSPHVEGVDGIFIEFETTGPGEISSPHLQIETPGSGRTELIRLRTDTRLLITPGEISFEDEAETTSEQLDLHLPEEGLTKDVELTVEFTDRDQSVAMTLPNEDKLEACQTFLDKVVSDSEAILDSVYPTKEPDEAFFIFIREIARVVTQSTWITMVESIVARNRYFYSFFEENKEAIVANLITHDRLGSRIGITDPEEYKELITQFDDSEILPSIEQQVVLKKLARKQGDILLVLTEKLNIFNIDESIRPTHLVPQLIAQAITNDEIQTAKAIISKWKGFQHCSDDEYETIKEEANETYEFTERPQAWLKVLRRAGEQEDGEFKYVAANYLYWTGSCYDRDNKVPAKATRDVYAAAHLLFDDLGMESFAAVAGYYRQLYSGYYQRIEEEYVEAIDSFSEAVRYAPLARNRYGNDFVSVLKPLFEIIQTHHFEKDDRNEYESLIEILERGLNVLRAHPEESTDYHEPVLEAYLHEARSNHFATQQQWEQAVNEVEKAIEYYSRAGRDRLRDGAIVRQYELKAKIAQLHGEFEKASDHHARIAEELSLDDDSGSFHHIKSLISELKASLTDGNIKRATETLDRIEEKFGVLEAESKDLRVLTELYQAYRNGETSSIVPTFNKIDTDVVDPHEQEYVIDYGADYSPAVTMILAAQRLANYSINPELLETLIQIAIEDVLTQRGADQLSQDAGLVSVQVMENWRRYLLRPLNTEIEDIELQKSTNTGNLSGIGMDLLKIFEQQLEAVAEYHARQALGAEWKQAVAGKADKDLTLGDLIAFFQTDEYPSLDARESVYSLFTEPIVEQRNIVALRNDLAHGNKNRLSNDEFEALESQIKTILKTLAGDLPIVGTILSESDLGAYTVRLHCSETRQKIWMQTEADLTPGENYYLPAESVETDIIQEIPADEITPCTADRVVSNVE